MKKILLIPLLVSLALISISFASAQPSTTVNYTASSQGMAVTQLTYSPYPANPGEYIDLWIQAEYLGSGSAPNATFILEPSYPFSLDFGANAIYTFPNLGSTPVLLHYKVRVDQNAVQGNNELNLDYNKDGSNNYAVQAFNISVANSQTNFDLVVQGTSSTGTSVGIANTGENTANSLIVRIPSQSGFAVQGTNGQIVGNLNAGDYTIVTFDIIPTFQRSGNQTSFTGMNNNQTLQIELDYTDTIGVRRTEIKEIPFSLAGFASLNSTSGSGNYLTTGSGIRRAQSGSIFNDIWFWITLIIVIGGGIAALYIIRNKRKRKHASESGEKSEKLKVKKPRENSKEPDWVSEDRTKKR